MTVLIDMAFLWGGNENAIKLDSDNDFMTLWTLKKPLWYMLQKGEFYGI